jgi:hypothetical protein
LIALIVEEISMFGTVCDFGGMDTVFSGIEVHSLLRPPWRRDTPTAADYSNFRYLDRSVRLRHCHPLVSELQPPDHRTQPLARNS